MSGAKAILNLIPLTQSAIILSENVKLLKKKDKKVGDFLGTGVKTLVGIKLTKETSDLIGRFE